MTNKRSKIKSVSHNCSSPTIKKVKFCLLILTIVLINLEILIKIIFNGICVYLCDMNFDLKCKFFFVLYEKKSYQYLHLLIHINFM